MPSTQRRTAERKAPSKQKTAARTRKPMVKKKTRAAQGQSAPAAKSRRALAKPARRVPVAREPAPLPTPLATFYF